MSKRTASPTAWQKGVSGNPNGRPRIYINLSKEDVNRAAKIKSKYGITIEEYDRLFALQGGVCAICGKPETKMQSRGNGKEKTLDRLVIDHNHETGKVRGLLCYRCNTGIGKLHDDPNLLKKAAVYLEEHRNERKKSC